MSTEKIVLIALAVVLVVVLAYYHFWGDKSTEKSREGFLAAGDMTYIGTILPDGLAGNYDIIDSSQKMASGYRSLDDTLKATDFAELVDSGDQARQAQAFADSKRPLERLQNLTESYFPTVASKALPFSQAAAKPLVHHHAVNLPRVNMKGKLYEMNLTEAIRGTLPINYDPNVSLVSTSQYRNEDVFNSGYFSSAFNSLHDKLTGGYKNLPMYLSNSSAANGVGGMGVELIMDV
jgi:hypothetical protein